MVACGAEPDGGRYAGLVPGPVWTYEVRLEMEQIGRTVMRIDGTEEHGLGLALEFTRSTVASVTSAASPSRPPRGQV